MNTHKRNFFGLFFLFYFAAYAVSPIIYTLSAGDASEILSGKDAVPSFAEGFSGFLLESVGGKFIPRGEEPSNGVSVKFLLMKKRAVLPEDSPVALYPDASLASEEAPSFLSTSLAGCIGDISTTAGGGDHHPLYLCHSPPAALLLTS